MLYVAQVKWWLKGTRPDHRPQAAAKLVTSLLTSTNITVRNLALKLDPDEYCTEASVQRLLKYLEESPLSKAPLPEAGERIGRYFRRLHRKRGEVVADFVVREDHVHDGMWKALKQKTNITARNLAQLGIKVDVEVGHRSDRSKNNEIDGRP